MANNKKVIIINYSFPPVPGVGGRRWAKFAKYLALNGHQVYAIGAKNIFGETSQWTKDTEHSRISYMALPIKYPKVIVRGPRNFSDKILYRLWMLILPLLLKGNIFEKTAFWKNNLLKTLEYLVKEKGVNNIIVSIPPFRNAYFVSQLKNKYPHVNIVIDYRDPWTINNPLHGFKDIKPHRLKQEERYERLAIDRADHVLSVSEEMTEELKVKYGNKQKIQTITNGFDDDDMPQIKGTSTVDTKITFIYAGTIYSDVDHVIEPLLNYLKDLRQTNENLYNRIEFRFYGKHNKEMKGKIAGAELSNIVTHPAIPLPEMIKQIQNASACVLIPPPKYSVVFNTKFFEYILNKKPIISFAYPCYSTEFLVKNKLGYNVNPDKLKEDMDNLLNNWDSMVTSFNKDFDVTIFSVKSLTKQLEKLLIQ